MSEQKNEITVKLKWGLDEAKVHFVNLGIPLIESFVIRDIYLVKDNIDFLKTNNLNILANSIIIREVIGNEHDKKLIYKDKKYDDNGNIVVNKRYCCPLVDLDKTYDLLTAIGFNECFRYEQECLSYAINDRKILLQYIADLGLFAELENNKDVNDLINDLNYFNIPYYENNYLVRKDSLMIDRLKKRR